MDPYCLLNTLKCPQQGAALLEVGETLQRKLTKAHQALDLGWSVSQETACLVRSKLSFHEYFLLPLALASAKGVGSFAFFFFHTIAIMAPTGHVPQKRRKKRTLCLFFSHLFPRPCISINVSINPFAG